MSDTRLPLRALEEIRAQGNATANEVDVLLDIAEAAGLYAASTAAHYWRCEYRTAKKGWKEGDPPVIVCQCGLDELVASLRKVGGW